MGCYITNPRLTFFLFVLGTLCLSNPVQAAPLTETTPPPAAFKPIPLPFTKIITPQAPLPEKKPVDSILPLEVIINGAKSGTWILLERDGEMYAPRDAFEEWRVQLPPDTVPIDFKLYDQPYLPLAAIPGYKFKLDYASQSAQLLFSPEVFAATRLIQEKSTRPVVSAVLPSMFVNYDLNYSTSYLRGKSDVKDLGMLAEIGASNSWGVLTSSHAGRNLNNDPALTFNKSWVRLETTFTKDFPNDNHTLRLGDTVTRAGMWSRNVYFGGIQYGSNYALTPGFVSQPIPTLPGVATAPSTVEMYVNDVLRQVSSVPAGPFAIDNFPLLTGSGDVRMVVLDVLGRETVIEQSFFTSTQLLAQGLNDWSIEAGNIRKDIGVKSNHYGANFASGTWRHGYRNDLTFEGHTELSAQLKTLGVGMISTLPKQMLGKASIALSSGPNRKGMMWLLGMEHQRLRSSASLQVIGASANFHQLGQPELTAPTKLQLAGNWSYTTEKIGTFGLGIAILNRYETSNLSTLSANYSIPVGKSSNLSFTASRAFDGINGTSVGAFLVIPLDNNRIVSASANFHGNQNDFYVATTKNHSQGDDLGWRGLAGRQQDLARAEGGIYYTGRYGRLSGDASTSSDQTILRLGANGGIVLADRKLFATQRVDQSFAVAEVSGYENVGIGLGGNLLSKTDADGVALIPRLIPYLHNAVRLNPSELPISAELNSIEQSAVPAWRSAVKIDFPVRGGRGALLKIVLEDGEVAPAGAIVKIEGDDEEFYVARRGAAFVTGLEENSIVVLNWNNQQCKLDVKLPPEVPDEIARVGPLLCKGIKH